MVTRPTVLILGAGASQHYEFPSARDLKSDICEQFSDPSSPAIAMLCDDFQLDFEEDEFVTLAKGLQFSGQSSADAFLERNPVYVEVGKVAIAYCLIRYENQEKLFPIRSKYHLYEYIFGCLGSDVGTFGRNKLAIITFNYDRSIEHYLETALFNSNQTTIEREQTQAMLARLPIVHLYGQIGNLPWQARENVRLYRSEAVRSDVARAARTLKIISEKPGDNLHNDPQFLRAWELIDAAEQICFLGFGFHETNLERLKIDNTNERWKIYGTAKGLPAADTRRIKGALRGIELTDFDCLQILQHFDILS
jgi:hypothetical protein